MDHFLAPSSLHCRWRANRCSCPDETADNQGHTNYWVLHPSPFPIGGHRPDECSALPTLDDDRYRNWLGLPNERSGHGAPDGRHTLARNRHHEIPVWKALPSSFFLLIKQITLEWEIGRATCRESVCQYE